MKRIILGTAGHIDHGKSALVRALTGTETDRLKEERLRGISIELGFAHLDLGDDVRMGIVDVPGHERFVRHMVAGSGGIDLAALVIALDEGVMPQTVEHLDILSLLGIRLGLVVLTKLDLVDEELAELAEEDAKEAVKGTFLEGAPMVRVSAKTGEGLDTLRTTLAQLITRAEARAVHGLPRLPVDRVFTMKGHGTVVTGTMISGTLATGDDIEILPSELRSSVRSLQSHNRQEERVFPGERVAVNLRGVEQTQVLRGEVITHPGDFKPCYVVDVRLKVLDRAPFALRNRHKIRLHHYTAEAEATVVLTEGEALEPGEEALVQLRTASPIVPSAGDRFVLRALSPAVTMGGGVILNPRGTKLRARSVRTFLELDSQDEAGIVAALIRGGGLAGMKRNELLGLSGMSGTRLDKTLDSLKNARSAVQIDPSENRLVHGDYYTMLLDRIHERLAAFHSAQPLKEGMPKQELRQSVPGGDKLFKKAMETLVAKGSVVDQGDSVRLTTHQVRLRKDEEGLTRKILELIGQGREAPPVVKEIMAGTGADSKELRSLLGLLEKEGKIVKIKEDIYFSAEFVAEVRQRLAEFIQREGGITPSQFSQVTGSSRKYNIPLLEYFDRSRFTIRIGDQRVLRGASPNGGSLE
ncbi:MAG: selenocysteine-specific translation elongation factor [Thermodesulfobacteriota bacterium]